VDCKCVDVALDLRVTEKVMLIDITVLFSCVIDFYTEGLSVSFFIAMNWNFAGRCLAFFQINSTECNYV